MTSLPPLHQYLGLLIVLVLGQLFVALLLLINRDKVSTNSSDQNRRRIRQDIKHSSGSGWHQSHD